MRRHSRSKTAFRLMPIAFALLAFGLIASGCRSRVGMTTRGRFGMTTGRGAAVPAANAHRSSAGWYPVEPVNMGVRLQLPAPPRTRSGVGVEEDGTRFWTSVSSVEAPFGFFGFVVTYWEHGVVGDPLEGARELANTIFEPRDLQHRRSRRLEIPGFYGREDTGRTDDGVFVALRQYIGRNRIYVAATSVPNRQDALRAAEAFMGSIQIDAADALLPHGNAAQPVPAFVPDADFAVTMPPLTTRSSSELSLENATVDATRFESRHGRATYRITVVDLPERHLADAFGEVTRALSLGEPRGYIHASGFPGRVFENGGRTTRAYLTNARVYVIEATVSGDAGAAQVDAFVRSFRILG